MRREHRDIVQDLLVSQAQHALTVVTQELIALRIQVHLKRGCRAVDLDDKSPQSA